MNILLNWKTTVLGLGAVLTAAGHLLTHLGAGDTSTFASDIPLILAGAAAIFAKDAGAAK
ncbi:MAG: hypothetical protein AAGL98_00085 [Planctomycetota bacterium]